MAHTLSAKKRHRQSIKRHERNRSRQTEAKSAVRKAREAIAAGNQDEAAAAVQAASAVLDRTASKGALHANNAARRKRRLALRYNALTRGETVTDAPKRRAKKSSRKSS